jgi:hypothetical protein
MRELLKDFDLPIPGPLTTLCDRHGFHKELVEHLYNHKTHQDIENYMAQTSTPNCPIVLAHLFELEAPEQLIQCVLRVMSRSCPLEPLVQEMEAHGKLCLLQDLLESSEREGCRDTILHTALAKVYVDIKRHPEDFLKTNSYYDPADVGKYCEDHNEPQLAFTAYARARGACDRQLINVCHQHGLYQSEANYLMERQSLELWSNVLEPGNPHLPAVLTEVLRRASLTSTFAHTASEMMSTAKALALAGLQDDLSKLALARVKMAGASEIQIFARLMSPSTMQDTADRLFEEKFFGAARVFYTIAQSSSRLQACELAANVIPSTTQSPLRCPQTRPQASSYENCRDARYLDSKVEELRTSLVRERPMTESIASSTDQGSFPGDDIDRASALAYQDVSKHALSDIISQELFAM